MLLASKAESLQRAGRSANGLSALDIYPAYQELGLFPPSFFSSVFICINRFFYTRKVVQPALVFHIDHRSRHTHHPPPPFTSAPRSTAVYRFVATRIYS